MWPFKPNNIIEENTMDNVENKVEENTIATKKITAKILCWTRVKYKGTVKHVADYSLHTYSGYLYFTLLNTNTNAKFITIVDEFGIEVYMLNLHAMYLMLPNLPDDKAKIIVSIIKSKNIHKSWLIPNGKALGYQKIEIEDRMYVKRIRNKPKVNQ